MEMKEDSGWEHLGYSRINNQDHHKAMKRHNRKLLLGHWHLEGRAGMADSLQSVGQSHTKEHDSILCLIYATESRM